MINTIAQFGTYFERRKGHELFFKAHSFPRALLLEKPFARQSISVHSFGAKWRLSFNYHDTASSCTVVENKESCHQKIKKIKNKEKTAQKARDSCGKTAYKR